MCRNSALFLLLSLLFTIGCNSEDVQHLTAPSFAAGACDVQASSIATASVASRVEDCGGGYIEKTGRLQILADLTNEGAPQYFLKDEMGKKLKLHSADIFKDQHHGDFIRVSALANPCGTNAVSTADSVFALSSQVLLRAEATSAVTTNQKLLVIMLNFSDEALAFTQSNVESVILGRASDFLYEASFQRLRITGDVVGPYNLSLPTLACDPDAIADQALNLAIAAGVHLSDYAHYMYLFPTSDGAGCNWAGLGTVGGVPSEAWINGFLDLHTTAHELGHNLGLMHSNAWDCGRFVLGNHCRHLEYGDTADIMGVYSAGHFNAFQKELLGWEQPTEINATGDYVIEAHEADTANPKALKILRSVDSGTHERHYYYIEYRRPLGFDEVLSSSLTSTVLVHDGSPDNINTSHLLNFSPGDSFFRAGLKVGQSLDDWKSGIKISLNSLDATSAAIHVEIGPPGQAPSACYGN